MMRLQGQFLLENLINKERQYTFEVEMTVGTRYEYKRHLMQYYVY